MRQKFPDGGALAVVANAIAVAVSEGLNLEEQNILGNLLALAGASLLSIAAVNQANQSAKDSSGTTVQTTGNSSGTTAQTTGNSSGTTSQTAEDSSGTTQSTAPGSSNTDNSIR